MIQFNIFPEEKRRIITLSYDDGGASDERLVSLFNRYNVKATFHLNGKNYLNIDESEIKRLKSLYEKHEIACHTLQHGLTTIMTSQSFVQEVLEDRKTLEKIFNSPITGMSYPYGSYNEISVDILRMCGILYSRTAKSTMTFEMPDDFLRWHPTCHHRYALEACEKFIQEIKRPSGRPLLYIWGHSHDLKSEIDWRNMEKMLEMISGNEEIWYATNIEINRYVDAQHRLIISADESIIENPTNIDVWVEKDKRQVIHIPAGERIYVEH